MALFQGLYLFEIVLMILGVVLFLVALVMLRTPPISTKLPLFVVAVAMIAWPSVKSLQYKDGVVQIDTNTQALLNNPTDTSARSAVQASLPGIAARSASDPRSALILARAQYALGDQSAAEASLAQALQADPNNPEALKLKSRIESINQLQALTAEVTKNPANTAVKEQLRKQVTEVAETPLANPNALAILASAQAAAGEPQKALNTANRLLKIQPTSETAIKLHESVAAEAAPKK